MDHSAAIPKEFATGIFSKLKGKKANFSVCVCVCVYIMIPFRLFLYVFKDKYLHT